MLKKPCPGTKSRRDTGVREGGGWDKTLSETNDNRRLELRQEQEGKSGTRVLL